MEEAELVSRGENIGVAVSRLFYEQSSEVKANTFRNPLLGELTNSICAFHSQIVVTNAQVLDSYQ